MPHYVILRKTFDEEGEMYVLHRHTIPSFIPQESLAEEFFGRGVAGLEEFAFALHRHLILLSNRMDIVSRLKALEGVEEVKTDEAMRLVELITSRWTAKIILLDKGERCVVVNHDDERLRDVEKIILNANNEDEDIVNRVSQAM